MFIIISCNNSLIQYLYFMISYLIIAGFIFTIAIASGSIVISSQLKTSYKSDLFSTLLFFLAFYFTFGFYAIWGQMLVASFITPFVSRELLERITDIMVLLGSPFIIFASLMFVRFSRELSGRKTGNPFILWYILINVLIITGLGYTVLSYKSIKALTVVRYYFILLNFLFTAFGAYYFLSPMKRQTKFKNKDFITLALALLVLMLIENTLLLFYDRSTFIALFFIFSYFMYGGFLPVYIKYRADLSGLIPNSETSISFEYFCEKYAISPREKEIINEICRGLSNQQIADKLFISLQTVKDHTHRIYSKTECESRARLIRLVNECM